jgi:hypothetical protein
MDQNKLPVEKKPATIEMVKVIKKTKTKKVAKSPNIRVGFTFAGLIGMAYVAVLQTELFVIPELVTSLVDNDLFTISAALFLVSLFSIKTKK